MRPSGSPSLTRPSTGLARPLTNGGDVNIPGKQ
ncbi:hypothetical protein E2C01_068311 [Portunus trituberculatus]|uniref:Uncharacterized protein n=1 Tax=Portunus trituberculatus TaxID=210409 RepID=A0A5B7HZ32_PORTR|nr:hypothetical protein [Portunus trituberculatus]